MLDRIRLPQLAGATLGVFLLSACSGGGPSQADGNGGGSDLDSVPNAFAFPSQSDVETNALVTSAVVAVTGIDTNAPVQVTGGEYSLGCAADAFTTTVGSLNNGQSVCVRHQSASTGATLAETTLTVGGVSAVFRSTTRVDDTTPEAFSFEMRANADTGTLYTSATITVQGINAPTPIFVVDGEYSIGCETGTFTNIAGTIGNAQSVCVRHLSASSGSSSRVTTLTIGGVSGTFESITRADDNAPEPFEFSARENVEVDTVYASETVTILGINTPSAVLINGGEYSIGCGVEFTATEGRIENGQTICVRHRSASAGSTTTSTLLSIGDYATRFESRTRPDDALPDDMHFSTMAGVGYFQPITSETVTISGINLPVRVTITGGEYSLGCDGSFTDQPGTARNGDQICLRHYSSNAEADEIRTQLVVGTGSSLFISRTLATYLIPYFVGERLYGYDAGLQSATLLDTPGEVEFYTRTLFSLTLAPDADHATAIRPAHVVYVKSGRVYRVNLATGESHMPEQVSSLTDVCHVGERLSDYASPLNSWLILRRAGDGGDCGNVSPQPVAVRASATQIEGGVPLPSNDSEALSLAAIHSADGSILSILATERNATSELRRYDANLENPASLLPLASPGFLFQRELWNRSLYFAAYLPDLGQALVRYDENSRSSTVLRNFPAGFWPALEIDKNDAYIADQHTIYRTPHAANDASQVEALKTFGTDAETGYAILNLSATDDGYLAFSLRSLTGNGSDHPEQGIWSLLNSGANSGLHLATGDFDLVAKSGNRVFANRSEHGMTVEAAELQTSGAGSDFREGARWLTPSSTLFGDFPLSPSGVQDYQLGALTGGNMQLIRAQRVSNEASSLSVVDGPQGLTLRTLGDLPTRREEGVINGYGPLAVLVWIPPGPSPDNAEVYAFDTRRAYSLLQVSP